MTELRIGLVGAGHIAATHVAAWKAAPGCRVQAITDIHREAAAGRALALGIPTVAESLEQLLESCDVIDVCTPPQSHASIAGAVLSAGRHLLIEKPVVTAIEDWDRLRALLADSPSRLCVVHNIKCSHGVQRALRWVAQGRIGEILRLRRVFMTDAKGDRMLVAAGHWSHSLPGGRWFETLPHALYLTHAFAGPLELAHVTALASQSAPAGAPGAEVAVILRGERTIASIHYSAHCALNRRLLTLEGSEGVIEIDTLGDAATLLTQRDARWKRPFTMGLRQSASVLGQWLPDRAAYLAARVRGRTPHGRLIGAFARHLTDDEPHPTPLEEVDYTVRMGHRIGREIDREIDRARTAR